jgi:hypothetical protein
MDNIAVETDWVETMAHESEAAVRAWLEEGGDDRPDGDPETAMADWRARRTDYLPPDQHLSEAQRRLFQREANAQIGGAAIGFGVADHMHMPVMDLDQMLQRLVFVVEQGFVVVLPVEEETRRGKRIWTVPLARAREVFAASRVQVLGDNGEPRWASTLSQWMVHESRMTVGSMQVAMGRARFFVVEDGRNAVNLWTPTPRRRWRPEDAVEVSAFLEHVAYLVPVEAEREMFLDWLAHCEQHPEVLPHFSFLFYTPTFGIGRNWLASVLSRVWRGECAASVNLDKILNGSFNGQISRKRFAVVDELFVSQDIRHRRAIESALRDTLTAESRVINQKYGAQYDETNCLRWLLLTNVDAALPLPKGDRRVFVVNNPEEPLPAERYKHLYSLLGRPQFIAAVGAYLAARDVSRFNPGAKPPDNAAKLSMMAAAKSDLALRIDDIVADWPTDVADGGDLMRLLNLDKSTDPSQKKHFGHAMVDAGHHKHHKRIKRSPKVYNVWFLRRSDGRVAAKNWGDDQIVAAIEGYRKGNKVYDELVRMAAAEVPF